MPLTFRSAFPWGLLPAALLAAATDGNGPAPPATARARVGDHVLAAPLPKGWTAEPFQRGLRLAPADHSQLRSPQQMDLELEAGPTAPEAGWDQRDLSGRTVRYQLLRGGGGSGGVEFELIAWMACGNAHLRLRLTGQVEEPDTLDLEVAWRVLATADCRPATP